ncbi:MAG: ribosome recycling factor [Candidatus Saganbacteria bacterium]|nr:ribosome recycling factor [Candidatus Saganbacteria bacterium]
MADAVQDAESKMKKGVESTQKKFAGIRTGRANPSLLDPVMVDYYGSPVPLKQLANVSVPEPRMLVVQPYDKGAMKDIERGIQKADLGLSPMVDGGVIRLPLPALTEERRKDLVKVVKKESEEGKVAIRNVRRDAMDTLKAMKDKKELSEDIVKAKEEQLQKLTTKYTEEIDKLLAAKEKEIMEV